MFDATCIHMPLVVLFIESGIDWSLADFQSNREKREKRLDEYDYDSWEEDYGHSLSKRSSRQRSKVNYKFEEYESMIDSAIKGSESDPTILKGTRTIKTWTSF